MGQTHWGKTTAYAVGFNALYLNLQGREPEGTVAPRDKKRLLEEISQKLLQVTDPKTGQTVVLHVYPQPDGPHSDRSPDLVVGYRKGYRVSWQTAIGDSRGTLLEDNLEHWSGDHLIDPTEVPGVLLCNHKLRLTDPQLRDLAPTFLKLYKITPPAVMQGRSLLEE
jgi:predicted AlkP superfamily phosphohydrolase/phosphomutase